ncbi:MAG: DUF6261 family protein [Tannerellaceae bacterium]|jgi:hypothetical protein|nr:DUF6261 family protein [Tannerellaceae bacterium]
MKQINNYYLRKLEQRDSLVFLERVSEQMQLIVDDKFLPKLTSFLEAVDTYRKTLQAEEPSVLTTQLESEERNGKSIWTTIRNLADNLMLNYGKTSHEAGVVLNKILTESGGNPNGLSSARLTALFSKITKRIEQEIPRATLQHVGVLDWVTELGRSNRRLLEIGKADYNEKTRVPPFITSANARSRKIAERHYDSTVCFINAMSIYLNDHQCHEIISRINHIIEQAQRGTLSALAPASDMANQIA